MKRFKAAEADKNHRRNKIRARVVSERQLPDQRPEASVDQCLDQLVPTHFVDIFFAVLLKFDRFFGFIKLDDDLLNHPTLAKANVDHAPAAGR